MTIVTVEDLETGEIANWSLEQLLRWVNADTSCTDSNGDCVQPDGSLAMAGAALDSVDHDAQDCYRPYDETDWADGMAGFEDTYRMIDTGQKEAHVCDVEDKWCQEGANPARHPDHDSHVGGCNCELKKETHE